MNVNTATALIHVYPRASTAFAALKYSANKLNVPAIQTRLLARELFNVVVRTYSTLYSTLNPTYTPVYVFNVAITSSAPAQPQSNTTLPEHLQASNPAKFPANTAPTKNGALSIPFRCAASARSYRASASLGTFCSR